MKLQTKVNLGIILIFVVLAVGISAMSVYYANTTTIHEAENRVRIYTRAAWEILNGKVERIQAAEEILAQNQTVRALLRNPTSESLRSMTARELEVIRQEQKMDILNIIAPDGTVILRTRFPYNRGDSLVNDPMVRHVIDSQQSSSGQIILANERLDVEGANLLERCLAVGGDPTGMLIGAAVPIVEDGELIGILQVGSLLNGAAEKVDKIRDAVFENEYYKGKPVGTATIFMGDLRISTNVQDNQGRRAVGTRVSREVAEHVLEQGQSWTGRAFVVDTWYLSQYDPIRDPDGKIIGMLYVGELEQKYLDLRTRVVVSNVSVVLVGMVLALALSFVMIRGILEPIYELSEATRTLSEGDLAHRVGVKGSDEVAGLSASFNYMTEQLEQQQLKIEQSRRRLEELNQELQATNKNYMEMLGFVSHELKNPLASAVMSLYTVKDGYLGEINEAQRKSLESVSQSLDYFHEMIRNYLDLSRLEKGELDVTKQDLALYPEILEPVIRGLDRELQERAMPIVSHMPDGLGLRADVNLLKIVYDNLLSNALKYGREGGAIVLDAHETSDMITLSVQNASDGIPPDKMPLLFKKFSRLNGPGAAGKRGTGLGLYICKEIIEKHGGEIWADSKSGEWVKFSFTIPR